MTKVKAIGLVMSALDYVAKTNGIQALLSGSVVLDRELHPGFRSGVPAEGEDNLVVVPIKSLPQSEALGRIAEVQRLTSVQSPEIVGLHLEAIGRAMLQEFEKRSSAFARLPSGDIVGAMLGINR